MFYVPVIVFILIIIVTGLKRDLNEWKEAWFGFAVMICIYFTIVYLFCYIVSIIFFRKKFEESKEELNVVRDSIEYKEFQKDEKENNVFEYTLEGLNMYNIMGEAMYLYNHRKKYLENNQFTKIKNQNTLLIICMICTSFCLSIVNSKILIFFLLLCSLIIGLWILPNLKKSKDLRKVEISSKGIRMTHNFDIFAEWDKIELIGVSKHIITVIPKNSRIIFLVRPNEDIVSKIKKYGTTKVIMNN